MYFRTKAIIIIAEFVYLKLQQEYYLNSPKKLCEVLQTMAFGIDFRPRRVMNYYML